MGLDANGTKFLLYAYRKGVSFAETATIGRQSMQVNASTLQANFRESGIPTDRAEIERMLNDSNGFSEPFISKLGANNLTSFDASNYENATVVHDFNRPIPDEFKNRYSVVLDGGTLEHIFNYPVALKNCLEMVRTGGHFLSIAPANNFLGHGFYQLSPELFTSVLCPQNGYQLESMIIFEDDPNAAWYEVADPAAKGRRVTLINSWPAYILVIAKKIAITDIFSAFPQQSDYRKIWARSGSISEGKPSRGVLGRAARTPFTAIRVLRKLLTRSLNRLGQDRDLFKKIDPFE